MYEVTGTASLLLNLKLRPDPNPNHAVLIESLILGNNLPVEEFIDSHGNCVCRVTLASGNLRCRKAKTILKDFIDVTSHTADMAVYRNLHVSFALPVGGSPVSD